MDAQSDAQSPIFRAPGPGRRWDILCFGDPVADIILAVDQAPAPGAKVLGKPFGVQAGGTTANVACAASKLGARTAVYGRVGDDAHGILLRDSFAGFGVCTDYLDSTSRLSASAITMVSSSGEKSVVYLPIPTAPLDEARLRSAIRQTRVVYAMPYDLVEFDVLCRIAREQGALIAIDLESAVAPDPSAMWRRVERADIVFFNEAGFEAGTGEALTRKSMQKVLAAGPGIVAVTLGAAGAMVIDRHTFAEHAAFPARVVDTTGAGDTFNAAFLAATLEQQNLQRSLRFACAAASYAVAALGARAGLPARAAVVSRAAQSEALP